MTPGRRDWFLQEGVISLCMKLRAIEKGRGPTLYYLLRNGEVVQLGDGKTLFSRDPDDVAQHRGMRTAGARLLQRRERRAAIRAAGEAWPSGGGSPQRIP